MTANRNVNICTALNPWFSNTFVLTKLVPQKVIVVMARICQKASVLRAGIMAVKIAFFDIPDTVIRKIDNGA